MLEFNSAKMINALADEVESAKEYFDLAENTSDRAVRECFQAAAIDEVDHAKFLCEAIEESGDSIPSSLEQELHDVINRREQFRKG